MEAPPPVSSGIVRYAAVFVLVGVVASCLLGFVGADWGGAEPVRPYVWRDVAIVQFLCAIPLGWVLASLVVPVVRGEVAVGLAFTLLGVGATLLVGLSRSHSAAPWMAATFRAIPALALVTSAALAWIVLRGTAHGLEGKFAATIACGLAAAGLFVLPATYLAARGRHDDARLGELLGQSRLGEARALAARLLALDADANWNGHPLSEVTEELDRVVGVLTARVAAPLAPDATGRSRLERGRQLAMLGRTGEAIETLAEMGEPEAHNLRGTMLESTAEWRHALEEYKAARLGWESRPPSAERGAGMVRASTGIAYCERKLGRYSEAEGSYREVLRLASTGESHFLLARFYDDTQQAEKARTHARAAMALDPARYRKEGERLIRKLSVYQFGCLGVFAAESEWFASDPYALEGGLD